MGAGARHSAAHGRPATEVDELLRSADTRRPARGLHLLEKENVLLEALLAGVVLVAPRTSRLRVQVRVADVAATAFDLRNALAAKWHGVAARDLLVLPDEGQCFRPSWKVAAVLLVVGCDKGELIRCCATALRNDEAMLVVVQIGPARFDAHFEIAVASFFELALICLVM